MQAKLAEKLRKEGFTVIHQDPRSILDIHESIRQDEGKNPPSREVTLEEIQSFDPDLIVLSICVAGSVASKELLTSRPGWKDLRAVRANHLFVIDDSLINCPGPRLTDGARRLFGWIFQALHS